MASDEVFQGSEVGAQPLSPSFLPLPNFPGRDSVTSKPMLEEEEEEEEEEGFEAFINQQR